MVRRAEGMAAPDRLGARVDEAPHQMRRQWAGLAQDPSPDGFVFPAEKVTTPLSLDNLWRRYMFPKLDKIGLGWATFQLLRKTNASLSKKAGVDPKVASDQRGHGLGVSLGSTPARIWSRSEPHSRLSKPPCFGSPNRNRSSRQNGETFCRRCFWCLLVRMRGLEPPRPCEHMDLNHARLPIPPLRLK